MAGFGRKLLWGVLGAVIGAVPAFALAGPAFFADGPFSERLFALAIYALAMLVLGFGGGAVAGEWHRAAGVGLAFPVVPTLSLLSTTNDPAMYALGAAFVVVGFGVALVATALGGRVRANVSARRRR